MKTASMRPAALLDRVRGADWGAIAVWSLSFGLVASLGLKGGGYDPIVHDQIAIAIWGVLLAAVLVGALPRLRPGRPAWIALALLAAFVFWTGLSLVWTESVDRTWADLARVSGYLGILAFAVFSRGRRDAPLLVGAVAAAIALVAVVGLLSRLHPAWFPAAADTGRLLEDSERLSYPINYWNGLAALIAIGLPLILQAATEARRTTLRALAAATLPAMALALFLTLSRGGIAAALLALIVFVALSPDRLPKLLALVVAGVGSALLIAAADSRDALQQGLLNEAARSQGDQLLWATLAVCAVVGVAQAVLFGPPLRGRRPTWTRPSRRGALAATFAGGVALLVLALSIGAPGRISSGWEEFKEGGGPGAGTARLGRVAGQSRYQLWSAALREGGTKPLTGTGSGTFEFWWTRDGDRAESVRDTHSLYLQTFGELGAVGLGLLAAFIALVLAAGGRLLLAAEAARRTAVAAAIAGFAALCITAVFDWVWQIAVLPAAALLLASVLLGEPGESDRSRQAGGLGIPLRAATAAVAIAALVAIALPLATTGLVRQSEADARRGNLRAALRSARSAQNVLPGLATPRLQQALVLESADDLAAAAEAARGAAERESTNWRNWLVLSRIEAERGRAAAAIRAYRRARSLNPRSPLFER